MPPTGRRRGLGVSVSVALLLLGLVSVKPGGGGDGRGVDQVAGAEDRMVPLRVNVAEPPEARLMAVLMLPLPLAGPLEPVPV